MAEDLGIKRCWYHPHRKYPHYDIPKLQIQRIQEDPRVEVMSSRDLLLLMKTSEEVLS
jgi:hypothetical protein